MDYLTPTPLQQLALDWIFLAEGGDVDNENDPGGFTRFGISLRYLKRKGKIADYNGDGIIDKDDLRLLNKDMAAEIYLKDFWFKAKCHRLPDVVALLVFDTAVNMGVSRAIRILQHTVNSKADGIIGRNTLRAVHRFNSQDLIVQYLGRRTLYYHDLILINPKLATFARGWFNRLFNCHQFILENYHV